MPVKIRPAPPPSLKLSLGFYQLFWIFFWGCFLGVAWETLWCRLTQGIWTSRTGLVWGPFNLVYGLGAVVLTVCLQRTAGRPFWWSFLGGFVLGSAFEYLCSLCQELLFGSVSWQYDVRWNLNGRINFYYSLFWGALAVVWIKRLCPFLCRRMSRLPAGLTRPLAWVLAGFMAVNSLVSAAAVSRWSARQSGAPPENRLEELLDRRFDDRRMEQIYPNMVFLSAAR